MSAPDASPGTAGDGTDPNAAALNAAAPKVAAPGAEGGRGTEVRFHYSPSFPGVLEEAGCSLLISTYQAGQLVAVGVADGELTFSFRRFDRAMGVAVGPDEVTVAGREQIWSLRDHSDLAPAIEPAGRYDRCWLPRTTIVTGAIQCHEIAWGTHPDVGGEDRGDGGAPDLWIVNTLFSCLAGVDPGYSFVPRWRPPFITGLAAQDRCHLNGLAMRDRAPGFVTVMAATDTPHGWRQARNTGAILDVASGETVTTGLTMPHSPRWHHDTLFVLNSGLGLLEHVDLSTGRRDTVAAVPGYARGLAFHGDLAFVGLSRIRETAIFGDTPIAAYHEHLKCGVGVIDITTGTTLATLQFANGVEEIFDIQTVPGTRCPTFSGPPGYDDEIWLLPTRSRAARAPQRRTAADQTRH